MSETVQMEERSEDSHAQRKRHTGSRCATDRDAKEYKRGDHRGNRNALELRALPCVGEGKGVDIERCPNG